METIFIAWERYEYRGSMTSILDCFSSRELAEERCQSVFAGNMDGSSIADQRKIGGPLPLIGHCDDVSYEYWVEERPIFNQTQ